MTAASWLQQLQAQPWFAAVASQFAARGVQPAVWESTLAVENRGLDPSANPVDTNGARSWGLFQLNEKGVGAGYAPATLTNAVENARIAAARMATQLQRDGTLGADPASQLRSVEQAGWNGSLAQDPYRQSVLAAITSGGELPTSSGTATPAPSATPDPYYPWWDPRSLNPFDAKAWKPLTQPAADSTAAGLQQLGLLLTIGAVFLALIAGGFAVLAGGGNAQAPTIIPV